MVTLDVQHLPPNLLPCCCRHRPRSCWYTCSGSASCSACKTWLGRPGNQLRLSLTLRPIADFSTAVGAAARSDPADAACIVNRLPAGELRSVTCTWLSAAGTACCCLRLSAVGGVRNGCLVPAAMIIPAYHTARYHQHLHRARCVGHAGRVT